jgi:hypothetical protein
MRSFRKVFFAYPESMAVIRARIPDQVRHDEIQQIVIF